MLIIPPVRRADATGSRAPAPAVAPYLAGLLLGGALVGGLLGATVALAGIPASGRAIVAFGAVVVIGVAELLNAPLRLPQATRMIDRGELSRGAPGAFRFGFALGTGSRTFMPTTLPYIAAAGVLASELPLFAGIAAGAGFGAGRSLLMLWRYVSRDLQLDLTVVRQMATHRRAMTLMCMLSAMVAVAETGRGVS